jgi:hypothetical protein
LKQRIRRDRERMLDACDSKAIREFFSLMPNPYGYAGHLKTFHFCDNFLGDLFELWIFDMGCGKIHQYSFAG